MPAGYPVKVNYLTGDVLTAADLNDLAGTVNLYDPTAKGDLFPASSGDAVLRLAVGANDTILTADSTTATGLKWAAAAAGGGKVLQVIFGSTTTQVTSATNTFVDTGLTATITPTLTSSKVLALFVLNGVGKTSSDTYANLRFLRGSTVLANTDKAGSDGGTGLNIIGSAGLNYLDSPATTSATVYKAQFNSGGNTATTFVQNGGANLTMSTLVLLEIGA